MSLITPAVHAAIILNSRHNKVNQTQRNYIVDQRPHMHQCGRWSVIALLGLLCCVVSLIWLVHAPPVLSQTYCLADALLLHECHTISFLCASDGGRSQHLCLSCGETKFINVWQYHLAVMVSHWLPWVISNLTQASTRWLIIT